MDYKKEAHLSALTRRHMYVCSHTEYTHVTSSDNLPVHEAMWGRTSHYIPFAAVSLSSVFHILGRGVKTKRVPTFYSRMNPFCCHQMSKEKQGDGCSEASSPAPDGSVKVTPERPRPPGFSLGSGNWCAFGEAGSRRGVSGISSVLRSARGKGEGPVGTSQLWRLPPTQLMS